MNILYWIFGGTAVGKKTFIEYAARVKPYEPAWKEDGITPPENLVDDSKTSSLLVRWQWSREHTLHLIADALPEVQQEIWLLTARPEVQYRRACARNDEGEQRTEELLRHDSLGARWLAMGLAADLSIPLRVIDVSSDDRQHWRVP